MHKVVAIAVVAGLLLVACDEGSGGGRPQTSTSLDGATTTSPSTGSGAGATTAAAETRSPITLPTDGGASGSGAITGVADDSIIQDVFATAEELTGLNRVEMTLMRANAVTWNDGSLGCPEPGVSYTQALVDGFWIQLDLPDNPSLDYRVGADGRSKLCSTPGLEPSMGVDE